MNNIVTVFRASRETPATRTGVPHIAQNRLSFPSGTPQAAQIIGPEPVIS
jgi:hypothetical protein